MLRNSADDDILVVVIETIEHLKTNFLDIKDFAALDYDIEESIFK